jgi:hypothetical protein
MPTDNDTIAVSKTITALSVSDTKVIPKGASHPPNCSVIFPCFHVAENNRQHIINAILLPMMLIIF